MKGYGEKISRKQEAAIAALLRDPTIKQAARAVGVGEVTLWRWLKQEGFSAAYKVARRQVVEAAIGYLQEATVEAAATLRRNLTCGQPAVEVRAALGLLEQALQGQELLDISDRLEALERQQLPEVGTGWHRQLLEAGPR